MKVKVRKHKKSPVSVAVEQAIEDLRKSYLGEREDAMCTLNVHSNITQYKKFLRLHGKPCDSNSSVENVCIDVNRMVENAKKSPAPVAVEQVIIKTMTSCNPNLYSAVQKAIRGKDSAKKVIE